MPRQGEFALIRGLFAPLAANAPESLDLSDDAALLPTAGLGELVLSVDAVVSGVHFLATDPPETVARKALRVNLSDLAAMGATPVGVLLTAILSAQADDAWMDRFAAGLKEDLAAFGLMLLGGDTVSTPGPTSFSVTILGRVEPGRALKRGAAQVGDRVWVSGTLGDGALGLLVRQGELLGLEPQWSEPLAGRYQVPQPRVALGQALGASGLVHACMDISDGLCGDAAHICAASHVGMEIEAQALPLSDAAATVIADDPDRFALVLGGGDDYELLFTAPATEAADSAIRAAAEAVGVPVTAVGRVVAPWDGEVAVVRVLDGAGGEMAVERRGYSHA